MKIRCLGNFFFTIGVPLLFFFMIEVFVFLRFVIFGRISWRKKEVGRLSCRYYFVS